MEQHESYHKRVHLLIEHGDLEVKFLCNFKNKAHQFDDNRNSMLNNVIWVILDLTLI